MKNCSLFFIFSLLILSISCQPGNNEDTPISQRITVGHITVPEGFEIEELYKPNEHDQGSWVSITKDDKGRLYTSDQYGNIYRVTLPGLNNTNDKIEVKKLDMKIGLAQGLLWHKGDLYAVVNSREDRDLMIKSGFYKITDSNGDGEFDKVRMLRSFDGDGEHGPHNIILSPDGQSLYIVLGNHTDIPEDLGSVVPKVWGEDNLLPVIKDPSGHANSRKAPGGWVVKTDFEGKEWTLTTVGLRNTYDIAFNQDGELFGFDSDMEYDMGMPWYRPIRLCHFTDGADFGWRTGTGKFAAEYPDNLPGIANLGQGSPTGLLEARGLKFPSYYQKGLYVFDWSYGTMYYASLTPKGSSYTTEVTEFISGVPLPLTNGIAGDDGALYFLTGGRRLESSLYKVTYTGERSTKPVKFEPNDEGKKERKLRSEIEVLQAKKSPDKIDYLVSYLDNEDRFIRFSARVALENQDYSLWGNKISESKSPLKSINLALSIARHGNDSDRINALNTLLDINWTGLVESQKVDFIRAVDLLIIRMEEELSASFKKRLKDTFLPSYLTSSDIMNRELCKILSFLQVSEIIAPTIEKMETDTVTSNLKSIYLSGDISKRSEQYGKDVENMLRNMPNQQNISYAKSLSYINDGWTNELRERYFKWYNRALKKSGGRMYSQFIKAIQGIALTNVPESDRQYFEALAGEALENSGSYLSNITQPKGPGQNWTVKSVTAAYKKNQVNVNFENGENMFKASLCASCHSVNGNGGNAGPELTKIGTRFSISDLAEAIVDPSATISDRYRNTQYFLKGDRVVTGRLINETDNEMEISVNAFSPDLTTKFRKKDLLKQEESAHSPMPPALINRLNEQELSDLVAFLVSGGDKNSKVYKK